LFRVFGEDLVGENRICLDKRHQKPYQLLCGRFYLSHFRQGKDVKTRKNKIGIKEVALELPKYN
jgi:hypothetical protein